MPTTIQDTGYIAAQTNNGVRLFPQALTQFFFNPFGASTALGYGLGVGAGQKTGEAVKETVSSVTTGFKNLGLWVLVVLFIVFALYALKATK